jgi:hypothetical protein
MGDPVRVMLEHGKKRRVVACAFDWPGWDRSARIGPDVIAVLVSYRPRYVRVAELAGFGAKFGCGRRRRVRPIRHQPGRAVRASSSPR